MGTIKLMHAKLHRFSVTEANHHYVGSITIDQEAPGEGRDSAFRRSGNCQH